MAPLAMRMMEGSASLSEQQDKEAVERLHATLAAANLGAADITADAVPEVKALRGYAGILPEDSPQDANPAGRRR